MSVKNPCKNCGEELILEQEEVKTLEIIQTNQFKEWWNANCFYLDYASRREVALLIAHAHDYADNGPTGRTVWQILINTWRALSEGIGYEYLPEPETNQGHT